MKLFDSHCHLDDRSYGKDLDQVIQRARQADVCAMMVAGIGLTSSERAIELAGRYPGIIASVGVHPHDAKECNEDVLRRLNALCANSKVSAWGECGLDFNRMFSAQKDQEHWFARQIEIGAELNLPMIFHERDSQGRFAAILKSHWGPHRKGVVHCFSGTRDELDTYLAMGLMIGITGVVTHKERGRKLRDIVRHIPENRLLVETDAPYLTPSPERKKFRRNEPGFVRTVLLKLAQVMELPSEQLAQTIWRNTCELFNYPGR
ncbi:MAG: TatD family hydrolase [Desulfobacteraceae bacterium]|nr:TatD family hydrolase [Desulfobacteraceae bacterium]